VKRLLVLVAGGLLAATLSACGAGASNAGVAARVGDEVIELDRLERSVEAALEGRPVSGTDARAQATRNALDRMVNLLVYTAAAQDLGVEVTDADVQERRSALEEQFGGAEGLEQQAQQAGIPLSDVDIVIRGELLRERIGDALVKDAQLSEEQLRALDTADVAHILVPTKAEADRILGELRKGADFAALAKRFSQDPGSKDRGGVYANSPRGQFVPPFEAAIWQSGAKIGQLQGPVQTDFGFHIIKVLKRDVKTAGTLTPQQRQQALSGTRDAELAKFLAKVSADLDISINPRFGTWNAEAGRIEAPKDELSSPSPAPADPGDLPGAGDPNQPGQGQPGQGQPGQGQPGQGQPGQGQPQPSPAAT
jgi:peptidyl-prolyl cis-trans isomerase C